MKFKTAAVAAIVAALSLTACGSGGRGGDTPTGDAPGGGGFPADATATGGGDTLAAWAAWMAPETPLAKRGYTKMYVEHVLQADKGVDLDFLVGNSGSPVARDNH